MITSDLNRDHRAVSYALASCVLGTVIMRIIVYYAPFTASGYADELISSVAFVLPTQLLFFLIVPFCIYKFYGKRTVKRTLEFSSAGKFKAYFLLALPLGVCVYFITVGVSSAWMGLLNATGYSYSPSVAEKPTQFVFGYFVADVVLTAVLPAFCEEFAMRGGLLTTARRSFSDVWCVVLCGIVFGLFHQNIRQVMYTALFGAFAAYMTIVTKSIYPAVIMHFTNNFLGVFFDYAFDYGWSVFGNMFDVIGSIPIIAAALVFFLIILAGVALVFLMLYIKEKQTVEKKLDAIKDAAFDATNKRVVLFGEYDPERIESLEMEREVYGADYKRELVKPRLRDVMLTVGLGVVTLATTVFTYVWGFFY